VVEGVRPVGHGTGVGGPAERGELALEETHVLALDPGRAGEDPVHRLVDLGSDAGELGFQVEEGDRPGVAHDGPTILP
jgi:hypothetical protein